MLDLVFLPTYSRGLIPVNFREMDGAIGKADFSDALPLAPTSSAIKLPKPGDLTDLRPNREGFNLRDWAEQLEMHEAIVPKSCGISQWEKRVLHRVTYVERVPPPIASRPLFTTSNNVPTPLNVQGNAELIRLVVAQIPTNTTARTRLIVGNAVAAAINPSSTAPGVYPASALEAIVPWWRSFLDRARPNSNGTIFDPAAAALLQSLVSRTTTYLYNGFATKAFTDIHG